MMSTTITPVAKPPYCYCTLQQVRDSHLLSPDRMAQIEAEIERRILTAHLPDGRAIENARIADLNPFPALMYTRLDHERDWDFMRREIMQVVLTPEEIELLNRDALSAASQRQDAERYEKARKVPAAEYAGMVYDPERDRYYGSVDELLEEHVDEYDEWSQYSIHDDETPPSLPQYVWTCKSEPVIRPRDVGDLFEGAMDARGWDDMDVSDLKGVEDLQKALDAFVSANENVVSYRPDYTTAVILPEPAS